MGDKAIVGAEVGHTLMLLLDMRNVKWWYLTHIICSTLWWLTPQTKTFLQHELQLKNPNQPNTMQSPIHHSFANHQMITPEASGAFTGGVSPFQLKSMGVEWALAGHSERRTLFKESDEYINAQCRMLVENDMNVVLCIGETLEEFEKNLVDAVCEVQLKKNLAGITAEQMSKVVIAYEPVWAIGTGKVATPEQAQFAHATIREILDKMYGKDVAEATRILYGGSVGPDSVDGLLAKEDIDGALVGGASLDSTKFGRIINFEEATVVA